MNFLWAVSPINFTAICLYNVEFNLFQALCQCGRLKKGAGDERGLVEKDPARS